ncbi:MAG TPA: VWA domain-containing protein [Verrucomicrobiae bacterium]|nr:VWA domain-containing protein [Verrucomicrobiae bacterium]
MESMRAAGLILLGLAGACTQTSAQAPDGPMAPKPGSTIQQAPPEAETRLKVRVSLVNTPVTVRDRSGQMIHNLDAKNFVVTDNGVTQKITHFDLGGDPLSVVILMETSERIDSIFPEIRKTGSLFADTVVGSSGEAAVVGFNDSVDKLQDFTADGEAIEKTIHGMREGTWGSRLYDAMAVGVEMLTSRPQPSAELPGRRRILFIMSEATDVGSATKLGEVLRQAQLANITIYSVGLSTTRAELQSKTQKKPIEVTPPGTFGHPPLPGTVQTPTSEQQQTGNIDLLALAVWAVQHAENQVRAHALEVAATATGGAHVSTYRDQSIERAIDEIGGELHSQYSVSYTPTGTAESGYHEIKVSVDRPGVTVRARPGYYLGPPAS